MGVICKLADELTMTQSLAEYFASRKEAEPAISDLRGLEAPGPMVEILTACTRLKEDEPYVAHLPHVPYPIFPQLEARGMQWRVFEQADGSALILIRRDS